MNSACRQKPASASTRQADSPQAAPASRQQQERNGLRGREHADLARPGAEQQHRNNGCGGKAQLLGRLGRQVGARQKFELSGKRYGHG